MHRPKGRKLLHYSPKPLALLVIGILVPVLVGLLLSSLFGISPTAIFTAFQRLLSDSGRPLEWRDATQLLIVLVGVPAGFLLWLFRDLNVSGTLDNQRKDVNLKEFREIQMRAAGAMDEKLPATARETLQIAALHQLRAFLRGEYGDSFRRPAFELLRARLAASAKVVGTQAIEDWLAGWRERLDNDFTLNQDDEIQDMVSEVDRALLKLRADRIADTERLILREEWQSIFRSGLPLAGSVFDSIELDDQAVLSGVGMRACRFVGATLRGVHFEGADPAGSNFSSADLQRARFEGAELDRALFSLALLNLAFFDHASLTGAQFEGALLSGASLRRADLSGARLGRASLAGADLSGAVLAFASLQFADLVEAKLDGADLFRADLCGALIGPLDPLSFENCDSARFDDRTEFAFDWSSLSQRKKRKAQAPWLECGAIRAEIA